MRLPADMSPAVFDARYRLDHAAWRDAVAEICAEHALACAVVSAFTDGSNLVATVDEGLVVKIFPPFHRHQWDSERQVLPRLHGRLPVPVPRLVAAGARDDGWVYLIMTKLDGDSLESSWPALGRIDRARILEEVGATMAAAHAISVDDLATLAPEWNDFLRAQIAGCRARHERLGMPAWLVAGVDALVSRWGPGPEAAGDRVLLTGEYTPFNLLVQRHGDRWRLSGMIDLADAMVGPRAYDLLGPSLFSCAGDPALVAALLRGYHGHARPIDHATRMRLLALAVLHRHANFDVQIRIPGWRDRVGSLEALAELIWPP